MPAPLLTFEQAIPHLRRGFILRINGHDKLQGAQLQEDKGRLQLSFGDGNWESAADVPLLDLSFDVYDQKRTPSPEVQKLEAAEPLTPAFKIGDRVRHKADGELGRVTDVDTDGSVLVKFDGNEADDDEELHDAAELELDTSSVELGGGNTPAPPTEPETPAPPPELADASSDQPSEEPVLRAREDGDVP